MSKILELLTRKAALKDVEVWLYEQYTEIDAELNELEAEQDEDSSNA